MCHEQEHKPSFHNLEMSVESKSIKQIQIFDSITMADRRNESISNLQIQFRSPFLRTIKEVRIRYKYVVAKVTNPIRL